MAHETSSRATLIAKARGEGSSRPGSRTRRTSRGAGKRLRRFSGSASGRRRRELGDRRLSRTGGIFFCGGGSRRTRSTSVQCSIEPRLNSITSGELAASRGSPTDSPAQVNTRPERRAVPTRSDEQRTRTAAGHRQGDGVGDLDRRAVAGPRQMHVEDAVRAPERHLQLLRPIAAADLAACVSFELETAADLEVAADRVEPAMQALRVGQRVPHVLGVVRGRCGRASPRPCRCCRRAPRCGGPRRALRPCRTSVIPPRLVRVSAVPAAPCDSVPSASSRWVQNSRNGCSHRSTSCRGLDSTA